MAALIDVVEWRTDDRDVVVWHFPQNNLSTYTQLLVNESQEAVLFKEGQMLQVFGPGRHTLSTKNIPLLNKLFGLPFGGKNPFTAEIWYVDKRRFLDIPFQSGSFVCPDPDYRDQRTGKPLPIPLTAKGRYGIQIADAQKLIKILIGTSSSFTKAELTDHFQGDITLQAKSQIATHMQADQIGVMAISAYLGKLSAYLKTDLTPVWAQYGIDLVAFNLTSVDVDDSTQIGQQVIAAMGQQMGQSIAGYTWQQGQAFGVAKEALAGGTEFGMIGAMMMAGGGLFGGGGGGVAGAAMQPPAPATTQSAASGTVSKADAVRQIFCSQCAKSYPNTSKFCPFCGNPYRPCPQCGADNDEHAVRCVSCGKALVESSGAVCPKCGHPILEGAAFCANCGAAAELSCPRCHTPVKAGAAFCPACGKKL